MTFASCEREKVIRRVREKCTSAAEQTPIQDLAYLRIHTNVEVCALLDEIDELRGKTRESNSLDRASALLLGEKEKTRVVTVMLHRLLNKVRTVTSQWERIEDELKAAGLEIMPGAISELLDRQILVEKFLKDIEATDPRLCANSSASPLVFTETQANPAAQKEV